MPKTFDQSKDEIAKLCGHFAKNRESYLVSGVMEAHVRQSLIDPFFEALGWDVRNAGMAAPQYREVIPEDSLEIEGQQKAPDYTFRVGTLPKFFTEAKKCGINISSDPAPAYQLRRYGWSAKVSLSVLTDFEEFAVYDCSQRPRPNEKATYGRIQYIPFAEYPDRWREIWDVFSREAVWSGSFDQFAEHKKKRGTSEVDTEFLKDIEGWRDELARNLALRNERLSADDLNAAVQRIIDRIIFLRMAEDRGLEPEGQLLKLTDQPNIYSRFMRTLCQKADDKYNSGLFHFSKESDVQEAPDTLTPKLEVDDKALKPILQSLYFEHGSPYHFGVLPVEILGTVYERFLGKVIRLTTGHHAKVEEKPEVRKAGGVYYTPSYIVDYIVKNTVGKQIEGKSPSELAGTKSKPPLRVLDMACGSGSFLLGAYQFLLDHCLKWYLANDPAKHAKALYADSKGEWRLTIAERKRILITHLLGVDIDRQAVEVTKLSLLLKALEDEDSSSLANQMQLFHQRALPNLANNIKCGNSLIGPEYFSGSLIPDLDEMKRVNPFDWKAQFPDVDGSGGFDCIIGNPPYIRIQTMKEWAPLEVDILKETFKSATQGNYDIYVVFLEKALALLSPRGQLGFICPHKFFNAQYGEPIRDVISSGKHLEHVVHFGDQQIFDGATTYTCLLFLSKHPTHECRYVKVPDLAQWRVDASGTEKQLSSKSITKADWNFDVGRGAEVFDKLRRLPTKLSDISDRMAQGIRTSANEVYVLDVLKESSTVLTANSKILDRQVKIERKAVSAFLQGREIKPYRILPSGKVVIIPYAVENGDVAFIQETDFRKRFPHTFAYLAENKQYLSEREKGRMRGTDWYAYVYPKNIEIMRQPKILVPDIADHASFALDKEGLYTFTSGYAITLKPTVLESHKYILALLNSTLLDFYLKRISTTMRGGFFRYFTQFIGQLPIQLTGAADPRKDPCHKRIVELVDSILSFYGKLDSSSSDSQKAIVTQQVETARAEIDRLVFKLYDLTTEEIEIVQSAE
jgi:hypothetical protein